MTNKKPLLDYQKQRLSSAIDEISNPIFSTVISNSLESSNLTAFRFDNSDKSLPQTNPGSEKSPRPARRKKEKSSLENPEMFEYSERKL